MARFDQSSATCWIFTYKEGLLSPFAHDLRIDVGSFVIELGEENRIDAKFDAGSLQVDCAIVGGRERPDLLSASDRQEIEKSIRKDVLETDIYPEITFRSETVEKEDSVYLIGGAINLHGRDKRITFSVRLEGGSRVAEAKLHLPDYGIKPFSALFGAVRIKPEILIRVTLPAELT